MMTTEFAHFLQPCFQHAVVLSLSRVALTSGKVDSKRRSCPTLEDGAQPVISLPFFVGVDTLICRSFRMLYSQPYKNYFPRGQRFPAPRGCVFCARVASLQMFGAGSLAHGSLAASAGSTTQGVALVRNHEQCGSCWSER